MGFCSGGTPFGFYAPLWSGSVDSYIDLQPEGAYTSARAYGVSNGQQVGYARYGGYTHATIRYGTPDSFVDLHPPGAIWSEAFATDGVRQGGRASFPGLGNHRAVLWHGTPESCVHMNPPGSTYSRIQSMAAGVQVGWGRFGVNHHACLWRGTPESFVDMHPSVAHDSGLNDTTGRYHAGYITHGGLAEAGLWIGDDPESLIDLHAILGPDW